jgi:hypothetical protein
MYRYETVLYFPSGHGQPSTLVDILRGFLLNKLHFMTELEHTITSQTILLAYKLVPLRHFGERFEVKISAAIMLVKYTRGDETFDIDETSCNQATEMPCHVLSHGWDCGEQYKHRCVINKLIAW